jgi:hypothetical protein
MKHNITLAIAGVLMVIGMAACTSDSTTAPGDQALFAHSTNGRAGQVPAFYDGDLFTVNIYELGETAGENLEKNQSVNEIYSYADLEDPQPFIAIIDAIQGDGFNPLWEQELIVFNAGFTPHQFVSDEEVDDAVASGEITLVETEEFYRCSVVHKNQSGEE